MIANLEKKHAFSLIEIVLALGLVSFVMVAILGLSALSLDQSRLSQRDNTTTLIAQKVEADLANRNWSDLGTVLPLNYYFDVEGKELLDTDGNRPGTKPSDTVFHAEVTSVPTTLPNTPAGAVNHTHFLLLTLANPLTTEKQVIPFMFTRYD